MHSDSLYSVHSIVNADANEEPDTDAVARGDAVLVHPQFASAAECKQLTACALVAAAQLERELDLGEWETDQSAKASISGLTRLHVTERLHESAHNLSDALIARILEFVQRQMPLLGEQMLQCEASTLHELVS